MLDTIIVGSGPAGFSAAVYSARAALKTLVIASSTEPGGALTTTTEVDNFPGFDEGIMGPELMAKMRRQAERFGAEVIQENVADLDLNGDVKRVTLDNGKVFEARTVIYATGSEYRKLGLPNEMEFSGLGVSWCATCDGAFTSGDNVAVVGGGDSAMEEALFLTKFAAKVYLIHRKNSLRASKAMQERAFANEKIEFIWSTEVASIIGEEGVDGLRLRNLETGEEADLDVTSLFIAIGADPRTHLIHNKLELSSDGVIVVDGRSSRTNIPGVFAAGDVIDPIYKQAGVAAGAGIVAALDAEAYIEDKKAEADVENASPLIEKLKEITL
jgi:thioredoxin reductase (NADPH)